MQEQGAASQAALLPSLKTRRVASALTASIWGSVIDQKVNAFRLIPCLRLWDASADMIPPLQRSLCRQHPLSHPWRHNILSSNVVETSRKITDNLREPQFHVACTWSEYNMVRVKSEGRSKGCQRCRARKVKVVISRVPQSCLLTRNSVTKHLQRALNVSDWAKSALVLLPDWSSSMQISTQACRRPRRSFMHESARYLMRALAQGSEQVNPQGNPSLRVLHLSEPPGMSKTIWPSSHRLRLLRRASQTLSCRTHPQYLLPQRPQCQCKWTTRTQ